MSSRASYLVYYIVWKGEFEQNIPKIRLSIKDNTLLQSKFHWPLFSIFYKF